jgi:hypothetical protein
MDITLNTMMPLPAPLQHALDTVRDTLYHHPDRLLQLQDRRHVYAFFDTLSAHECRRARTVAALMVAQRVVAVYDGLPAEAGYPTMPRLMLTVAEQLLMQLQAGSTLETIDQVAREMVVELLLGTEDDPGEVYQHTPHDLAELAAEMDSLTGESPASVYYHAWCAFLAAMGVLREVLGLAWWNGDSAHWAACAYAGGIWTAAEQHDSGYFTPQGTWDYGTPEARLKRTEFWEWWCTAVIPHAWQTLHQQAG